MALLRPPRQLLSRLLCRAALLLRGSGAAAMAYFGEESPPHSQILLF